jgi:hypothetical protein
MFTKSLGIYAPAIQRSITLLVFSLAACGGDEQSSTPNAGGRGQQGGIANQGGGAALGTGGRTGSGGTASAGTCDPVLIATGLPAAMNCPALVTCAETQCAADADLCYGTGYASGNYTSGQCQAYVTCIAGCNCETTCIDGCASQEDQLCNTCINTLRNCASQMCMLQGLACAQTGAGGAGGAGQ